jgi:hypothetical protein
LKLLATLSVAAKSWDGETWDGWDPGRIDLPFDLPSTFATGRKSSWTTLI